MILVTHDMAVVAYACDRVAVMYAGVVVESGTVREVLERPLHPYTMGLTHAFPDVHGETGELVPIEGSPPSLLHPPTGCRFAPRCPFAQERCRAEAPPAVTTGEHMVACWRSGEAPALREAAARSATWAAVAAA
jgi:oligopeptide/dipeptide ABC transporter ATP-binding protein